GRQTPARAPRVSNCRASVYCRQNCALYGNGRNLPVVAARVADRYGRLRVKRKSRITHTVEKSMKTVTSFTLNLAAAVLILLTSATIAAAAAGIDVCVGLDASIGGTCTPLTNTTSDTTDSIAIGDDALNANTTGGENTAVGAFALNANTTGGDNTAAGVEALEDNTTGQDNTAVGNFGLNVNTTGT